MTPKPAASQQEDDHMGLQLGTLTSPSSSTPCHMVPQSLKAFPLALHSDVGKCPSNQLPTLQKHLVMLPSRAQHSAWIVQVQSGLLPLAQVWWAAPLQFSHASLAGCWGLDSYTPPVGSAQGSLAPHPLRGCKRVANCLKVLDQLLGLDLGVHLVCPYAS